MAKPYLVTLEYFQGQKRIDHKRFNSESEARAHAIFMVSAFSGMAPGEIGSDFVARVYRNGVELVTFEALEAL